MKHVLTVLCILAIILTGGTGVSVTASVNPIVSDDVLKELKHLIAVDQVLNSTTFDYPFTMFKQKGTYSSYIHENFAGSIEMQVLRKFIKFYDVNSFVTLWISSILLEISSFDNDTAIVSEQQLMDALNAISVYHDKNMPDNSSVFVFWPQTYNESSETWTCSPTNLQGLVEGDGIIFSYVKEILKDIGMEKIWDKIAPYLSFFETMTAAFYIPADFDDTFINMGLGSLLKNYQHVSTTPYKVWYADNQNLNSVLESLKKYAYRPFNSEINTNMIDPRTFFYVRDFIYEAQSQNRPLALITTWITDITKNAITFYKGVAMPFNVNNVDLTVSVNTIYGLTSAILYDVIEQDAFDNELQMVYENTTSLIVYEIAHNFSSRPDLALTYYPSVYNFFWFASRISNLLNSFDNLPYPVLERVRAMLGTSMKNDATQYILDQAVHEGSYAYFDDFLGDGDKDIRGKPVNHGDDRICSTAMATNTLFYTWTIKKSFVKDTPKNVKDTITNSCNWLNDNVLSGKYETMNAFFSGSIKDDNYPFYFPANFAQYLNGTELPKDYTFLANSSNVLVGVSGVIPEQEYTKMLTQKHYGAYTQQDFHGLKDSSFPFWSSEPFTYASTLLALTQCKTVTF